MTCYDEERSPDTSDRRGPTVVRDGNNVREIAANTEDFALHVRPRRMIQRDAEWRNEE